MEISPQKITLDINRDNCFQTLIVKQGDRNSRHIEVTMTADDFKIELADIASDAVFSASNKGRLVQNEAFSIDKNNHTVLVTLSDNALIESGTLECELSAIKEDDKVTSATFFVIVSASAKGKYSLITDLLEGIVDTKMIAKGAVTPEKLDRRYWAFGHKTVTSFDDLDQYLQGSGDITNSVGAIYQLGFDTSFEEYQKVGEDIYLAFINGTDNSGLLPVFKFILINIETFEMWSYVPGSKQIDSFTPSIRNEDNTVESRHIKAAAVTTEKIADGAVSDDKLLSAYYKISTVLVRTYEDLNMIFEDDSDDTVYHITFSGLFDTALDVVGKSFKGLVFENALVMSDGISADRWIYRNGSEEIVKVTAGGGGAQDFVYAGSFSAVNELINYAFDTKKVYRVDLSNILGGVVPLGCYLCRKYFDAVVWDSQIIELSPFVADGKQYIIVCETGECVSKDVIDVDSKCKEVEIRLEKVEKELIGLEELLASI